MAWVLNDNDKLINVDNYDLLSYYRIYDVETDEPVAYCFYLEKNRERIELGYLDLDDAGYPERRLEEIVKGVFAPDDLSNIIKDYLVKNGYKFKYDEELYEQIDDIIKTRFKPG